MTSDHIKARVVVLALRRGFGVVRIECVVHLVDRDGVMRELCRVAHPRKAWAAALDVLESA